MKKHHHIVFIRGRNLYRIDGVQGGRVFIRMIGEGQLSLLLHRHVGEDRGPGEDVRRLLAVLRFSTGMLGKSDGPVGMNGGNQQVLRKGR